MNNKVDPKVIAESFGVGLTTVYKIYDVFRTTGRLGPKGPSGRPSPVLQKLHKWALRCWLIWDPQLQIQDLQAMLNQAFLLDPSDTTVYRAVRNMRFLFKMAGISLIKRNFKPIIQLRAKYAKNLKHFISMGNTNKLY